MIWVCLKLMDVFLDRHFVSPMLNQNYKVGPLPVIIGVVAPKSRVR